VRHQGCGRTGGLQRGPGRRVGAQTRVSKNSPCSCSLVEAVNVKGGDHQANSTPGLRVLVRTCPSRLNESRQAVSHLKSDKIKFNQPNIWHLGTFLGFEISDCFYLRYSLSLLLFMFTSLSILPTSRSIFMDFLRYFSLQTSICLEISNGSFSKFQIYIFPTPCLHMLPKRAVTLLLG